MIIRKETQSDIGIITNITKAAYENHPYSNQTEHLIICALRAAQALTISLVAEDEGKVVGHIAFSPVTFTDGSENWYGLGPVSVVPEHQRQGIGTRLTNEGLRLLKDSGARGCALVGDPDFYKPFGFQSPVGLSHEGVPQENFMVLSFDSKIPTGLVHFHPAFSVTK